MLWHCRKPLFMEFFRVLFLVAAPCLRFIVFAEAQDPGRRAEFAHFGIGHEFFFTLLGRVRLRARNPAEHGRHEKARK